MTKPLNLRVLLTLFCLFSAGCATPFSTTAGRKASFAPYADAKIGQSTIPDFLLARSTVLFNLDAKGVWHGEIGWAAAIDRRGYYLTAAHCVHSPGLRLISVPASPTAQVVWCGDVAKNQPDLAILYTDSPPAEVFEWAADFKPGDVVLSPGITHSADYKVYGNDYVAGKLLAISNPTGLTPSATLFSHDAPLHPGDSGGPLVMLDGRLLGINASVSVRSWLWGLVTVVKDSSAYRPDLAWLRQTIDTDFAQRTAKKSTAPATPAEPADSAVVPAK